MKKYLFISLLITAVAFFAAAKEPVYVDIASTNQRISDLQARIDAANQQNSDLASENTQLEQDIQNRNDQIAEAQKLLIDLGVSRGELYAARNRANDQEQKKRIIEQLEKNMGQDHQIHVMIDKFTQCKADCEVKIAANKKQIARNNYNIADDTDEIGYLQSCVELTSNSENSLDEIFSKQSANTSAYDSFMSANQE